VLFVTNVWLAALFLSLAFFFIELTNPVLWAIPMDVDPAHAGLGGGLMNTGFGIAGIVSPLVFGFTLDKFGNWAIPFGISAALLIIGAVVVLFINPRPINM
jgi:MFS family permease